MSYVSAGDKTSLVFIDKVAENLGQPVGEELGQNLVIRIEEGDRPVIANVVFATFFINQCSDGVCKPFGRQVLVENSIN